MNRPNTKLPETDWFTFAKIIFPVFSVVLTGFFTQPSLCRAEDQEKSAAYEFQKGLAALQERNFEEAKKWFLYSANKGYPDAQYFVGYMDSKGWVGQVDWDQAFLWFKKSAKAGKKEAQYQTASCYFDGKGTKKDPALGMEWLEKSVNQGEPDAECRLGICYARGEGVTKNPVMATKCFKSALEHGCKLIPPDPARMNLEGASVMVEGYLKANTDKTSGKTTGWVLFLEKPIALGKKKNIAALQVDPAQVTDEMSQQRVFIRGIYHWLTNPQQGFELEVIPTRINVQDQ